MIQLITGKNVKLKNLSIMLRWTFDATICLLPVSYLLIYFWWYSKQETVSHETELIFLINVPLKWLQPEAFFSPKCTIYRLATGLRPDQLGELIALHKSLAGFEGHTSEGRGGEERGRRCGEVKGGRQRRKEGVGRERGRCIICFRKLLKTYFFNSLP